MILEFFRKVLKAARPAQKTDTAWLDNLRERGLEAFESGEYHGAIDAFLSFLDFRPEDIEILNSLGCCYANLGRTQQASVVFQRACALDDTNLFSLLNRANLCVDNKNTEEALGLLRQAMVSHLALVQCEQILSRIHFFRGDSTRSTPCARSGWLAHFDDLRAANHYLFSLAYPDDGEATLAIEHRFWGDTLKAATLAPAPGTEQASPSLGTTDAAPEPSVPFPGRRVRIGYWSPDFREHSVRFFSRPLIESHDRLRFEIFAYHDYHETDHHTDAIREAVDHFHDVSAMKDRDLEALLRSHELDVLVELAGHTSFNRLAMFAQRLARLQINGLGYPPTTGLRSMDGKIMDATICPQETSPFYTERPLRLPSSLWCFDPKEDIPLRLDPPAQTNGHITFACMGNLAKINRRTLQCWAQILNQVPDSHLLVRAFNYQDPAALKLSQAEFEAAGLPMDRVKLAAPVGVAQLFQSYGDVDIVLDTFPFNGGTTSCFAAYMGVPVVSRFGQSLVSRVGLSILTNLKLSHLAVDNDADYVKTAVALAHDVPQLQALRARARELFRTTALGNGQLFAREFEATCLAWLAEEARAPAAPRPCLVPTLPPDEMVRRAYALRGHGNTDAARRVVELCLHHHPHHANAHVFVAQQLASEQSEQAGLDYLLARMEAWSPAERPSPLIAAVHLMLRMGQTDAARTAVRQLADLPVEDGFDRLQIALFESTLNRDPVPLSVSAGEQSLRVVIVVPCLDAARFHTLRERLLKTLQVPPGGRLQVVACDPQRRWQAYAAAAREQQAEILIALHPNVSIARADVLREVARALKDCDVLSFGGAQRWDRLDWRNDRFDQKSAGYLVSAGDAAGCELRLVGSGREALATSMAVLDGGLLAMRPDTLAMLPVDEELARCDTLMEELWCHEAQRQGLRLGVHRGLGVVLGEPLERPDIQELSFGRQRVVEHLDLDPLKYTTTDDLLLSALATDTDSAIGIAQRYLSGEIRGNSGA